MVTGFFFRDETAAEITEESGIISSTEETSTAFAELTAALDRFLGDLNPEARRIFMRRYWYFCKPAEIASAFGISSSLYNKNAIKEGRFDDLKAAAEAFFAALN